MTEHIGDPLPQPPHRQRSDMSYTRMRLAFGNGDKAKGKQIMEAIAERLEHARRKHPPKEWEGQGPKWAAGKLADELSELHRAISLEGPEREKEEAKDCAAVIVRIIGREFE